MWLLRAVMVVCIVPHLIVIFVGIMYRFDYNEREDQSDEAELQRHFEERKERIGVQASGRKYLLVRNPPQGRYPSKHRIWERWKLAIVHMLLPSRVKAWPPGSQKTESEEGADAECQRQGDLEQGFTF